MKKFLVVLLTLTMVFAFTLTAMAAPFKDNPNQNFDGFVEIDVIAPGDAVVAGDEAQIAITIVNGEKDRGLPQISLWVNGEQVAFYEEITKGGSVTYMIDVDTSAAGEQVFDIAVWTRIDNKNFADELYAETVTVTVVEPEKTAGEILLDFIVDNPKIFANGGDGLAAYLSIVNGKITVTIGDLAIELTAGNNLNVAGSVDLGGGYILNFDIAGNGKTVKVFEIVKA